MLKWQKKLGVTDSLVSIWCRDARKSRFMGLVNYYQGKRNKELESEKYLVGRRFDKDLQKLFCGLIYGCEGAKYPASNLISLVNSDPKLINTFVNLLRKSFTLDESKWHVHLQMHSNHSFINRQLLYPKGKNIVMNISELVL